jgi:hypothetical protein
MNSSSKMDLYAPGMKREDGRPNMRHRYYLPTKFHSGVDCSQNNWVISATITCQHANNLQ